MNCLMRASRVMNLRMKVWEQIFMRMVTTGWDLRDKRYLQLRKRHDRLAKAYRDIMDEYDAHKKGQSNA